MSNWHAVDYITINGLSLLIDSYINTIFILYVVVLGLKYTKATQAIYKHSIIGFLIALGFEEMLI